MANARPDPKSGDQASIPIPSSAEQTRQALILAALKLFGAAGYDGASTREIAAAANANIGSIAYHFSSKEGLRQAVADYIVTLMQGMAEQAADAPHDAMADASLSREAAEVQLQAMLERALEFFVASPQAAEIVPFMLREMSTPTVVFERVYTSVVEPLHRRFCNVWAAATGQPAESEATKLSVFSLIGQMLYFRLAREAVKRRMGWNDIGSGEMPAIAAIIGGNLQAAIAAQRSAAQLDTCHDTSAHRSSRP